MAITLRKCPMCHTPHSEDGGPQLLAESVIDLQTGNPVYDTGFTVRCTDCGTMVSHEYVDAAVNLWNGDDIQPEEAEGTEASGDDLPPESEAID